MKEKILLVDDDPGICEILEFNLKSEGYLIRIAHSAEDALKMLDESISLILLDVMMGGMSGYKMAERLHAGGSRLPIIFLTAKDSENDMLTAFSVGADDYISKPFSIKEVLARIRAVLQRTRPAVPQANPVGIELEGLKIDFDTKEVQVEGRLLPLTKTEYSILELLINSPQHLFSRDEIIERVWGESVCITERTVDVHIARLRKKMGIYASFISNRPGFGYRFEKT